MKKQIFSILFIIILIFAVNNISYAANATISCNNTAKVGEEIIISVNGIGVQWNLSLKVNGTEIAKSSELDNYENNKTISFSGKYTPTSEGTLNITLEGTVTEYSDGSTVKSFETKTITVTAKETIPTTPIEPETPTEPETPSVEFKKVDNETVYATSSVRVRSSCTTSTSQNIIGSLKVGQSVIKTGIATKAIDGIIWSRIIYNNQTAYVSDEYLTTEKTETTEEPVEEEPDKEQPTEETPSEETPEEETPTEGVSTEVFGLSKLEIKNQTLSPKFDVKTYEYTIGLKEDISSLEIEAVANDEKATVEIIGNENLKDGENIITIIVTNSETGEIVTYQIIVNKNTQSETVAKVDWLQPSTWGQKEKIMVTMIGLLVVIIIVLIIIKIRTSRNDFEEDLDLPGAEELDRALIEHQELTENEEIEEIEQEEKSKNDLEESQEYFEQYSKRKGKHF